MDSLNQNEEIELEGNGGFRKFTVRDAESLLAFQLRKNYQHWKIPKGANLKYSNGKLHRTTGKRKAKGAKK